MPTSDLDPSRAALHVGLAVVIGVSLIGFVAGTSARDYERDPSEPVADATPEGVPEAPRYTDLRQTPRGAGSGWAGDVAPLVLGVLDAAPPTGDKAPALTARAAQRAYDGAPPTIPHAVRQDSAAECLACHDDGLHLRGRTAAAMSHAPYASCTQCHVVDAAPMPGGTDLPPDPRAVDSAFVGLPSPEEGARAWPIAPPEIPHRTFMRERCDACHGPQGSDPLRTSHPDRQSCTQCHAPSAERDQRPGLSDG